MSDMENRNTAFRAIIEEVARSLASVRHEGEASYVRTPILYPGGSLVVVRVEQAGRHYLISDMGLGFVEADQMGAEVSFGRTAPHIAEKAGIAFEHHSFIVKEVSRDQLVGAVATVAACSQEAVQITAMKLSERKTVDASERLYGRLIRVFTPAKVTRHAEVYGASNTPWSVAALVKSDDHQAVFEPVTDHPNSVASAVAKFVDLSQLDRPPARVAVVHDKKTFGTRLNLIASAAKVIEEGATDRMLERVADLQAA
ncbi:MAG: hypothetical protein HZC25_08055 [Rhodospirillales bacterium]|nr:hypothetical protein [Rhodospirillales bacterium]